ncbi:MAG TPA: NAD(P)/FAD-dependent oxidoreductase, partial [Chthonomonadaceae bacterium]|nr:NAD(P)/FAD-dependent oxidoreductase [Chthonomonadaceae bacterium]
MGDGKSVVIIGAGLAGLCCARTLQRAGFTARIYEAGDDVGGRVRTDRVDGYQLDRGFQTVFTAYPAIQQEYWPEALKLAPFDPGAIILYDGKRYDLGDPLRKPLELFRTAFSPLFPLRDKLRLLRLRRTLRKKNIPEIFKMHDKQMGAYLRECKFTHRFLDRFLLPLYSGIFLERSLTTSVRMFAFTFKMLSEGQIALPAAGMGALAQQIAADLEPDTLFLNSPVEALPRHGKQVTGIRLANGETIPADQVVVATPADVAAELTGLKLPQEFHSVSCVYFALPEPLYRQKKVLLFADPNPYAGDEPYVNHAALLTNIAPSYAPPGKHLLSVSVLGNPRISDAELAEQCKAEIAPYFPRAQPQTWRLMRVYRIPLAQFAQPVSIFDRIPETETEIP